MEERSWPTKGPASYFPSIERTYGQPIQHWLEVIAEHPEDAHGQAVARLTSDHGLGHGHANALVAWYRAEQRAGEQ